MDIAAQDVPTGEYVTGIDATGLLKSKQVGIEEVSYVGVFGIESTSSTTAAIQYGNTDFAFDTIYGLKVDYTVEGWATDEPGQYIYGIIRAIDTATYKVTILITVAPGAAGGGIYSNWRFQVVAGPSFGVVASATGGITTTSMAVPAVGDVVNFTTDTGKLFDPGSTLLLSAIADSTGAPAPSTNYFEIIVRLYDSVAGTVYGMVNKIGGSGTYSAWLVQRTEPVNYHQAITGLSVSNAAGVITITPGSVLDSTGRVPIYSLSSAAKLTGKLWAAGSGSAVGVLKQLAGLASGSAGATSVTGVGTAFVADVAATGTNPITANTGFTSIINGGLPDTVFTATNNTTLVTSVVPVTFTSVPYAFAPWTCFTTLFIIRKDSDGTVDFIEQVGTGQALTLIPAGYTYYAPIATLRYNSGVLLSVQSVPLPINAPSWLLVASGSFPAAATQTVAIPAGYSDLQITFTGASSNTATREFQIRFSTDSGSTYDSTAGNYPSITLVNAVAVGVSARATAFQLGTQAAADVADGVIVVEGYAMLAPKLVTANGVSVTVQRAVIGRYLPALAITNIQFGWDASGNFDAGTYTVSVK